MKKLLDAIMFKLLNSGCVNALNYDIVRYGLELNIMKTIINIIILIVAFVTDSLIEIFSFMCAYQPLRSYSGGYHAKTRTSCLISSLVMLGTVIVLCKLIPYSATMPISLGLMIIGVIIIVKLAPIDTSTKPFDDIEQIVFRKRTLILTAVLVLVYIILLIINLRNILLSISLATLSVAFLLILGKIKK